MIRSILEHRRVVGNVLAVGAVALIAYATLLPSSQQLNSAAWCLVCGTLGGVDITLNLLLFAPLGLGLALGGVSAVRAIVAMCVFTLAIETLQLVIPGRDPTLSDLLTNSIGGAGGFVVGVNADRLLRPAPRAASRMGSFWLVGWLGFQMLSGFLLISAATESRYRGQIKRQLGSRAPFSGEVLSATLDGNPVPNTAFTNSIAAERALNRDEGGAFDVIVVPRDRQSGLRSIVRVVDAQLDEIALLARSGSDFVFGVRTNAAHLRLRPLYFALRGAFPQSTTSAGRDTLRFRARYARNAATVVRETSSDTQQVRIPLTPALAWRLLAPGRAYADGSLRETLMNATWIALWLIPAAFWLSVAHANRMRRATLMGVMLAGLGLVGVPRVLGLSGPGSAELIGVLAALATGAVIARGVRPLERPR